MRRAVLSFLIIFGSLLSAWQVAGQGMLTLGAGSSKIAGGTVGTLSADGTASNENGGGTNSITLTLSTTKTNDVIAVCPGANGQDISSVSGGTIGAFTKRITSNASGSSISLWYNVSAGTLTNEVITVSSGTTFIFGTVLAVNGADISSPLTSFVDPNGSLPASNTTGTPTGLSTTKNATLIMGCMRGNGDGAPPDGTWTDAAGGNRGAAFMAMDYKIFASAQTSIGIADTMTGINGWVADAIKASGQ